MTKHAVLNNVDHHDLCVIRDRSAELGDNVMCAQLLPQEFRDAQNDYPIFFHKNEETGKFLPYAMFGLQENENLYLEDGIWNATYLPFLVERGPFSIGLQQKSNDESELVISIDLDHPRVSRSQGEALFLPQGGYTDYLNRISYILKAINAGVVESEAFVEDLLKHDLLEPFALEVDLSNGSKHRLEGFYTINEKNLINLSGEALQDLSSKFFLPAAYMVVASLSNIRKLIRKKSQRL